MGAAGGRVRLVAARQELTRNMPVGTPILKGQDGCSAPEGDPSLSWGPSLVKDPAGEGFPRPPPP